MTTCSTCARQTDRPNGVCFRCHVQGISFTFVGGGGYGRQAFHDNTTAEVIRQNTAGGPDIEVTRDSKMYAGPV